MSRRPSRGPRFALYARYSSHQVDPGQVDPVQAAVVGRIHAQYATGLSPLAIALALNDTNREPAA